MVFGGMNPGLRTTHSKASIVILASFMMLFLCTSAVLADTTGPVFTEMFPADGAVLFVNQVNLSVTAHDADNVDASSVVLKVDGAVVSPIVQYAPIDESTDDYTTLTIDYWKMFSPGSHTAVLSIKDQRGNLSSKSWAFSVGQPAAKIVSFSPTDGQTVNTKLPALSVSVSPAASIDASTIIMKLNNSPVTPAYDPFSGTITYVPSAQLNDETVYTVSLTMKDVQGNPLNASWKFIVNTYQDMSYTVEDDSCLKCHDRKIHPMGNCGKCHGSNTDPTRPAYPLDDCYKCHFNTASYPVSYHTDGLPAPNPPDHPVQITYSCTDCHVKKWSGTVIPAAHDVSQLGLQHTTATNGCTPCHNTGLTREHQRRTDAQGNTLDCYTCHNSPEPKVQTAIKNKDSNCMSCHGGDSSSQHPEHNNGLDQSCQSCHSSTILSDQQYHGKNSCGVCHENKSDAKVAYALSQKDTSCFACHDQGHNLNFVRKTPSDIPLYPGYKWSVPQDATLWAGESWLPPAFNTVGAKMVISNRRGDLSGPQLFDWYTRNLASDGWEKISGANQGSQNFTLEYHKGSRLLTVIVYAGATHDSASAFVGYRVELLYK